MSEAEWGAEMKLVRAEVRAVRDRVRELLTKSEKLEIDVSDVRHRQNEIKSVLTVLLDALDRIDERLDRMEEKG